MIKTPAFAQGVGNTRLNEEDDDRQCEPVSTEAASLKEAQARIADLENQLLHSRQMLQNLVHNNPMSVQIYNIDGYVVECNEATARIFGGFAPPDYCMFQDPVILAAGLMEDLLRVKQGESIEFPDLSYKPSLVIPGAPEAEKHLHAYIFPIKDSLGQPEAYVVMHQDITDSRMAEEKFRLAFHAAPIPMTLAEAYMGPYLEINEEAVKYIGYSREEAVGRKWSEMGLFSPEDQKMLVETMYREGHLKNVETNLTKKDGTVKRIVLSVDYVEIHGKKYQLTTVMDITERTKMERALQDSEEKFRLFAENALDGFAIVRVDGFHYVNPAFCKMIGYTEEELLNLEDFQAFMADTPLGRPLISNNLQLRLQGDIRDEPYEAQLQHRDGITIIDVVVSPARVVLNGEVNDFVLVRNNSAQKKAERGRTEALAAMQASEEKYRSLFRHTPVGVVNYDNDLIITDSNDRFLNILETDRDRLIGLDMKHLRDPIILPALQAAIQGQHGQYEGLYTGTSSNIEKWIILHTAPVYLSDGSLAGGVAIIEDIGSRREAEMERDRLRLLLENTFDSMPSILVGIDAGRRITQWNREAMLRTGLSHNEAQGQLIEAVLPTITPMISNINASLSDQSIMSEERLSYYEDGEIHFARVVIYPLVGGEVRGAVIRMDDVTETVRLEEMMIQTEKMMSVGGMAAGMAHEINNPLGGILQGSQNILRRLDAGNTINQQTAENCGTNMDTITKYMEERGIFAFVEGIRSSGERASSIVSNMLQFSRASSAQKTPASLSALVEQTIALAGSDYDLNKSYDFRHINIVRDYDDNLPEILCSPMEIEQVVLNLVKNAAQAMAGSAKTQCISLRTRQEENWAVLEITDNGPGMDENTRRRIFEPFYTTKPTGLGTGLGLAVSYFIITTNHKGQIFVESQPGKGTMFCIRLPLPEPI